VAGTADIMKQADAGMKLFKKDAVKEVDLAAATAFKEEMEAKMAAIDAEVAALTGKENKKARTEKEKEKAAMKNQKDFIDACKIAKGLEPVHGFFTKAEEEPAAAEAPVAAAAEEVNAKKGADTKEKKEKPKKAMESAGLSPSEKKELEDVKNKIIEKKKALKEQGMSGGQINKDEEVVGWVARMNELKEKENPGCLQAEKDDKKAGSKKKKVLDSEAQKMLDEKQRAFEEYTEKLRTEFKYSKKEIAADPDYIEMKAAIDKMLK